MPRRFVLGIALEMAYKLALGVMAIEGANKSALYWHWLRTPIVWNTKFSAIGKFSSTRLNKQPGINKDKPERIARLLSVE